MTFFYVLVFGLGLFLELLIFQFIWWRIQPPRRHTKALVFLFLVLLVIALPAGARIVAFEILNLAQVLQAYLLYAALFAAYLITYSAIEVDSPSLLIVQRVAEEKDGLERGKLYEELGDEHLLIPRVNDLVRDQMLEGTPAEYRMTPKGRNFIRIFVWYRNLLKRSFGG